jgi:proline dehydrogenase
MRWIDRAIAGFLPYTPKPIVRQVAQRYIAGETMDDAIRVARNLNARGLRATMDILGEDVHRLEQAKGAATNYSRLLDELERKKINSNVSVKLTQLGLKVDKRECLSLAGSVVEQARQHGNFVRIDMEDSSCTSDTLDIYAALRRQYDNVGVVLQAYLHRTGDDLSRLMELTESKPNFRLCKGVYVEAESIAYQEMEEINRNYLALLERMLRAGIYVGIATHDEKLIRQAQEWIAELKLPPTAYEFQMLLGVNDALRDKVHAAGHPLRVYIPFGRDWYAYSVRRLRENPRLAGYVLKAMFTR